MARLIDADALMTDLDQTIRVSAREENSAEMRGIRKVLDRIKAAPTISPDEVRGVGEWKMWEDYYGSNVYQCSVCGADWDMIDGTPEDNDMNYCPNCGAKMEVSEDARKN